MPTGSVFLVGILPALLVVWIRRAVPEPEEWHAAKAQAGAAPSRASWTCSAARCAGRRC